MLRISLFRFLYEDDHTAGLMFAGSTFIGFTIENPWKNNRENESCIPLGLYPAEVRSGEDSDLLDYDHIHIRAVQDRDYILIHKGNTAEDVKGCIIPGESYLEEDAFDFQDGKEWAHASGEAFNRLMEDHAIPAEGIKVDVRNLPFTQEGHVLEQGEG